MYKAYRFILYPNDKQQILIHKTFGCYRFVYNYFLDKCKNTRYIKAFDMCKELTGKYYVSVIVEEKEELEKQVKPRSIVGIDLGVKDLVVTSSGEKYKNPKEIEKYEKRIKRIQRKLARQVKGSKNYQKTKVRIAKLYAKLKNARKHNIVGIVNKLVKEYDIIISEKLDVKEMSSNHKIAKNILDASFNQICEILKWKAKQKGKYYYQVDKYFPSSKICSHCGERTYKTNDLGVRNWICDNCSNENDRDINASINIMFEGLKYCFR